MVQYAMDHGVNYYDTAWGYHNGTLRAGDGPAFSPNTQGRAFTWLTKFPGYDLSNMDKVEEIFEEQLKKCQTEYFDFYLFHNVCEMNIDAYLDESHTASTNISWSRRKTDSIRHLGFSAHGNYDVMKRFLEKHTEKTWNSARSSSTIWTGHSRTQRARWSS